MKAYECRCDFGPLTFSEIYHHVTSNFSILVNLQSLQLPLVHSINKRWTKSAYSKILRVNQNRILEKFEVT